MANILKVLQESTTRQRNPMSSDHKRNETIWQARWLSAGRHLAPAVVFAARLSHGGHADAFVMAKLVFQSTEQNLEMYTSPLTIATYSFHSRWVSGRKEALSTCVHTDHEPALHPPPTSLCTDVKMADLRENVTIYSLHSDHISPT